MTAKIKPKNPTSLLVDYDCEVRHQVEIDLADASVRTPVEEWLEYADAAHAEACAAEPRSHYRYSDAVLVRGHVGGGR